MAKPVEGSMWFYAPHRAPAIVFMILFLLSGSVHLYQNIRYKTWRITVFLPWAAIIMGAGFALRVAGASHLSNLDIVIASNALVMSGPPIYAASNYLVLSRVLFYVPYLAPMHPGRVLTTFLGLDVIIEALILQGALRATDVSGTATSRRVGDILVKATLTVQAVVFAILIGLAAQFHIRARRARVLTRRLRTVLIVLYITSATVAIRCLYRIVEYFEGYGGALFTHEFYFYIFDAGLMFATTLILNVWHPGKRLPRSNNVYLAQDGVTELRGLGWGDRRNWLVTTFDPFDLVGLCKGRDKRTKFWEMSPGEIEAIEAERQRNKRAGWKNALDPFHLWGSDGTLTRLLRGEKGGARRDSTNALRPNETDRVGSVQMEERMTERPNSSDRLNTAAPYHLDVAEGREQTVASHGVSQQNYH